MGVALGAVESSTARLRLGRVPQLLLGATALSALAMVVLLFRGAP
jgi:formate hydrogenlyase subunit 4